LVLHLGLALPLLLSGLALGRFTALLLFPAALFLGLDLALAVLLCPPLGLLPLPFLLLRFEPFSRLALLFPFPGFLETPCFIPAPLFCQLGLLLLAIFFSLAFLLFPALFL